MNSKLKRMAFKQQVSHQLRRPSALSARFNFIFLCGQASVLPTPTFRRFSNMRFLWPTATLIFSLVVVAQCYFHRVGGCDAMEDGGTLYLRHEEVETVRGRFCYSSDCRLIAE